MLSHKKPPALVHINHSHLPQLTNMSKELNDLKSNLRSAAASLTDSQSSVQESSCSEPTFSSSEAAVQAILECLKSNGYLMAIRYIRECRLVRGGGKISYLFFCLFVYLGFSNKVHCKKQKIQIQSMRS